MTNPKSFNVWTPNTFNHTTVQSIIDDTFDIIRESWITLGAKRIYISRHEQSKTDWKDGKVTPFCVCALIIIKKRGFSEFFPVSCLGIFFCLYRHVGVPLKS